MIHPLQLRYAPAANISADAWFLPGHSTSRWLDELARCGMAGMETRLFVVPRSISDRTPAGLLVVPDPSGAISEKPTGIGCRLIAGRLFVPLDAVLHPPLQDTEVLALCALPISFYHPIFGLSGFESDAALRVSDLIDTPEETVGNWNFARPGSPAFPELSAIVLLQPPSMEDIFGGAEDEISTDPLMDLPPAPDEPKDDSVSKTMRDLERFVAKGVAGILRHLPHTGSRRTWVNDMEDWATRHLTMVNQKLEWLRNKELNRLLHLLETDPEAGLRQAIPLNSFGHRGTAPPSNRLGSRSLNFDPSRLGGRAADFWNIPFDLQETLRRRYREMADREMQLGRHRRAAYIYAELLGDLVSAVNALKQGRLFREAALVYEEHLKNPLEAARCLAEGGLLAEAIERYEKLGRWLEVADLHERVGNDEAAAAAIRRVVNERLLQNDILGAAKLVDERLRSTDEALEMLLNAWPNSAQAASCIGAALQLLARLGRHDAALERIVQFGREEIPTACALPLVATLTIAARSYPDERVKHRAADFARVLIARQLQRRGCGNEESGRFLEHLVKLAPQDRLLSRDANRYVMEQRALELRSRRVTPPPVAGKKPAVHRRFELPRQIQWLQLRREWHWFFALGVTPKRMTLLRGSWDGEYQSLSWDCPAEVVKNGFIFEPAAQQGSAVVLARTDGVTMAEKRFPAADTFFSKSCIAGTPSWLPPQSFPLTAGDDTWWTVHVAAGRAVLSCYDKTRGGLLKTIDITDDLLSGAERTGETQLSLAVLGSTAVVALGNRLVLTGSDGRLTRLELPGQAVRMFGTIPNTRRAVAVMLNHGAVLHWLGTDTFVELDRDIQSPMGAFVPGGPLVLVSGLDVLVFEVDSRGIQSLECVRLTGPRVTAVSATANPGEFALLGDGGEVTVYRMPR